MFESDNSLRKLAMAAKKRLNRASKESELQTNSNVVRINLNYITYKNLYNGVYEVVKIKENDDELYYKICNLLDNDFDNPYILGELIDTKVFKKLNEEEKQRYIINLSDKYLLLKEKYIRCRKMKITS